MRSQAEPVAERLAREGQEGLDRLPAIGKSLAAAIAELVHTGRLRMLDRLEGEISPEDLFTTVPGIGEDLARRIHEQLQLDTLEELELAAHDGRLAQLPGFGERRVRAVREALAGMLGRGTRRRARLLGAHAQAAHSERPTLETLLAVDAEYRRRAAARRWQPSQVEPAPA